MKVLRVGDPHVKPSNLEESERAMEYVIDLAKRQRVDRIEILGDLFHTHAILRLEVLDFWNRWLNRMPVETVVLVGNHDMTGDKNSDTHALEVFKEMPNGITVVDEPILRGIYGYLPYQHSQESFLSLAQRLAHDGARVLVCHQTLGGAQYENGFYAPDAIDPSLIPFDLIISGHIHKRQIIKAGGKTVIYPGTFRWDTVSDANEIKGLTIYEHDSQTGQILSEEFFPTADVCPPIISVTWQEGDEHPDMYLDTNARVTVELVGSSSWVKLQKEHLKGRVNIKTKITDSRLARMQSGTNLEEFINKIFETHIDKQNLLRFMKEEGLA